MLSAQQECSPFQLVKAVSHTGHGDPQIHSKLHNKAKWRFPGKGCESTYAACLPCLTWSSSPHLQWQHTQVISTGRAGSRVTMVVILTHGWDPPPLVLPTNFSFLRSSPLRCWERGLKSLPGAPWYLTSWVLARWSIIDLFASFYCPPQGRQVLGGNPWGYCLVPYHRGSCAI